MLLDFLEDDLREGLDAIGEVEAHFTDVLELLRSERPTPIRLIELAEQVYVHAVEGTYGDPVYGGNRELKGWAAIGYEGDRHPKGYTPRQMLHPEEPL